ncbi:MAG TPA: transcription factor S [Candidatus Nanoarchaeia archaeon]|nr:transcription factor S [Candidatus Nanoarchaeia archaeon]
MFCPKCGSIMRPKVEDKKKRFVCSCGYKSPPVETTEIKEKVRDTHKAVEVVHGEFEVHPKTKAKCPKCSNDEAFYWMIQTRAADEPETKFLRCTKCKHTWRDYK